MKALIGLLLVMELPLPNASHALNEPCTDRQLAPPHVGHGDTDIAYHVEWNFREEAMRWRGDYAIAPNFYPLATEFRQWLLREGPLTVFAQNDKSHPHGYTNPYTYHCSSLAAVLADAINASHAIATSAEQKDPLDAEIQRIRSYGECVLNVARLCEALTKQLLYCTQIPEKYYKKASLGALLSTECHACRKSARRHKISLLGSLAHRYGLCLEFEGCLEEHLKIVGRRRNVEAAHSDSPLIVVRSAAESREQLKKDIEDLGNEFVHMLGHIGDLERRMESELVDHLSQRRPA